jgi:anthranilate synthase component 1
MIRASWRESVGGADMLFALPLHALRDTLALLHTDRLDDLIAGLPPLTGGLVGLVSYDAVRRFERLPDANPNELGVPELAQLFATDLAVLDHVDGSQVRLYLVY